MFLRTIFIGSLFKSVRNNCKNYHTAGILGDLNQPNLTYVTKRFNQSRPLKCWQCGIERKNISELFCEQCNYLQSPRVKKNYFKIFELEETYNIDQKLLANKYRELQSLLHPDKFTNKSHKEQGISEEFSSLVNKAYSILQTPLKRAVHLLNLKGETIEENHKIENPDFLMEIMELNEEVEKADDDGKLRTLKIQNDKDLEKIGYEINNCFENFQIKRAKELIVKMKYYSSVSHHINRLMREKGIVD